MKIRVLSDLHLEFYRNPDDAGICDDVDCDVVVLAGDTSSGFRGIEWAAETFDRPVVYVMGNHEYYGHDMLVLLPEARRRAALYDNVHLLEQDEVAIGGFRFLGCTLWSGFMSGPSSWQEAAMTAQARIADFRYIRYKGASITPEGMSDLHATSVSWLENQLTPDLPSLVVTHFSPTVKAQNPLFPRDELSAYFHNDIEYLMGQQAQFWIYGHHHYSSIDVVNGIGGKILLVSNQKGYPRETVTEFQADYVLDIPPLFAAWKDDIEPLR